MCVWFFKKRRSNTYQVYVDCLNCCEVSEQEIPSGLLVSAYLKTVVCPYCACRKWGDVV